MVEFEWDTTKAVSNRKKHGVSFEEAKSVFYDEFAIQFFDDENSEVEDRFLILGHSNQNQGFSLFVIVSKILAMSFELSPPEKQQQKSANSIQVKANEKRI